MPSKLLKTTDFQLFWKILIEPSLLRSLSNSERNFEKWCFGEEEEAQEVCHFCQTMLVHVTTVSISFFSTRFFGYDETTSDVCTERQQLDKNSILTTVSPPESSSQKFTLQHMGNIPALFHVCFSSIDAVFCVCICDKIWLQHYCVGTIQFDGFLFLLDKENQSIIL